LRSEQNGDLSTIVDIEIEGIGHLRNTVEATR
jgi:2-keto-4-pentenoate hydratase/2-oxohepta-3-ene-1,7-dioic acid hydratase in catechol pathway